MLFVLFLRSCGLNVTSALGLMMLRGVVRKVPLHRSRAHRASH
jgi:hypothetical protein